MVSFSGWRLTALPLALCLVSGMFAAQLQTPPPPLSSTGLRASANVPSLNSPATPPLTPELRGDIYMARKMYRDAIDMYREGPDTAVLANKVGIAFHQLLLLDLAKKNYQRAIKYYKRAIKFDTKSASIYANLGAAYFGRKDYKRATLYYQQALKLDPDVFEHHSTFGTLMQERTVEERATFHLYLAKIYAKSGANDRALIYLRKALEEGVKDRKKIPDMPEFASLKTDPAFKELLAENPKPL